jgi:hypothetical protein
VEQFQSEHREHDTAANNENALQNCLHPARLRSCQADNAAVEQTLGM